MLTARAGAPTSQRSGVKMMNFAFKMVDCVLKMMNYVSDFSTFSRNPQYRVTVRGVSGQARIYSLKVDDFPLRNDEFDTKN